MDDDLAKEELQLFVIPSGMRMPLLLPHLPGRAGKEQGARGRNPELDWIYHVFTGIALHPS
jgi:hypothetical protein